MRVFVLLRRSRNDRRFFSNPWNTRGHRRCERIAGRRLVLIGSNQAARQDALRAWVRIRSVLDFMEHLLA
jgi:hypothetical protein